MFNPGPSVPNPSSLFSLSFLSHYRRFSLFLFIRHRPSVSTFLRPLAPRALSRFFATMDALTPLRRLLGPCGLELRSVLKGLPAYLVSTSNPSVLNHSTTPAPPFFFFVPFMLSFCTGRPASGPSRRVTTEGSLPSRSWPGLRTAPAVSPVGVAESGSRCVVHFVTDGLFTSGSSPPQCCHGAVAFGYRPVNA